MTIKERLNYYLGMVRCSHMLHLWTYSKDMKLLTGDPDLPEDWKDADFLSILGFSELLLRHLEENSHDPVILANNFGLIFFCAFETKKAEHPSRIYAAGPLLSGHSSQTSLKRRLEDHDLPVSARITITRELEKVPVIPSSDLMQYVRMLHYCVTGEHIDNARIQYLFTTPPEGTERGAGQSRDASDFHRNPGSSHPHNPQETPGAFSSAFPDHTGIYESEQRFLSMIREGNPGYRKALDISSSISSGVRVDFGDPMRKSRNDVLVLLTLVSRAAMDGGLSPAIAYSLNDLYAQRLEKCSNYAELTLLTNEMLDDYVTRVRDARTQNGISIPVRDACDYILLHVRDRISIAGLAARAGYTEYYFSHKFQKETGLTVAEYVRKVKMEEAERLLTSSSLSIQEIADELSLGSRSSFFTAFRNMYGLSPSEYRRKGPTSGSAGVPG